MFPVVAQGQRAGQIQVRGAADFAKVGATLQRGNDEFVAVLRRKGERGTLPAVFHHSSLALGPKSGIAPCVKIYLQS